MTTKYMYAHKHTPSQKYTQLVVNKTLFVHCWPYRLVSNWMSVVLSCSLYKCCVQLRGTTAPQLCSRSSLILQTDILRVAPCLFWHLKTYIPNPCRPMYAAGSPASFCVFCSIYIWPIFIDKFSQVLSSYATKHLMLIQQLVVKPELKLVFYVLLFLRGTQGECLLPPLCLCWTVVVLYTCIHLDNTATRHRLPWSTEVYYGFKSPYSPVLFKCSHVMVHS